MWERLLEELEDLEEGIEKDFDNDKRASKMDNGEEMRTYGEYKNTLQVLKDLELLGEDVSESIALSEELWKKSKCNPTNIRKALNDEKFSMTENYYEVVRSSLIEMQEDGIDVMEELRLLEECWAKTGLSCAIAEENELKS